MNHITLIGFLTSDPQLVTTSKGISCCKFVLAVKRRFEPESSEFFNIVTWRGLAENCKKYLSKGKKAAVMGSVQTRSFEDKNGVKRYVTEIVADEVEFLSPKEERKVDLKPSDEEVPF